MKPVTDVLHDSEGVGNHDPTAVVDVAETRQYGHKRLGANRKTESEEALEEPFILRIGNGNIEPEGEAKQKCGYMYTRKWMTVKE